MNEDAPRRPPLQASAAFRLLIALAVFGGAVWLALLPLQPPAAAPADAPGAGFSAIRAMEMVTDLARAPRPVGTAEHDRVRQWLVEELRDLDLEPEIQTRTVVQERGPGGIAAIRVHNVLARIGGTASRDDAVLLVAHYDSETGSPGASDNGAGVAVVLETARAVLAGKPNDRDVILLFTDAEEIGLAGAHAFIEHHRWSPDVGTVLNFEARGSRGPAIMFETGTGTGPAMVRLLDASPRPPFAASFGEEIYSRMPNDTDFTVFRRQGLPGFNFAHIHGFRTYHSELDVPERLDPRTVQHHGDTALALVHRLAASDPPAPGAGPEPIYFNLPGLGLIAYSTFWSLPLVVLTVVLLGLLIWRIGKARGRRGWIASFLLPPLAVTLATAAVFLLESLWVPGWLGVTRSMLGDASPLPLAWLAVAVAVATAVYLLAGRHLDALQLGLGGAVWWVVLAVLAVLFLPAAAYLFVWPALFAEIALFVLARRPPEEPVEPLRYAVLALLGVPALLLWVPALALLPVAFGYGGGSVLALAAALLAVLLAPQLASLTRSALRWPIPVTALALAVTAFVVTVVSAGHGTENPRTNTLLYALDADGQSALWLTLDSRPDPWLRDVLGEEPETVTLQEGYLEASVESLGARAPVLPLPAPEVQVTRSEREGDDGQRLTLRVRSARGAPMMRLALNSRDPLRLVRVDGVDADLSSVQDPEGERYGLNARLHGQPSDGHRLVVVVEGKAPVTATAADRSYELPADLGLAPRPADLQRNPFRPTDLVMVRTERVLVPEPAAPVDAEVGETEGQASSVDVPYQRR